MRKIFVIAKITFKSALRDRILYAFLAFAALYLLFTIFLGVISLKDMAMIKSFGLAGIYIFGVIIAIFLGSSILYKDVESRVLYFILSKPVSRRDIILGKFFGLFGAVALTNLIMAIFYLGVILYQGGGFDYLGLLALFFQLLEMAVFIAFAIFASVLSTPLAAAVYSSIILFVGHLLNEVMSNAIKEGISGAPLILLKVVYYIFPNLEKFNIRNLVVYSFSPTGPEIIFAVGYALVYSAILLYLAYVLFEKIEL